ncbi:uncharacterized protein LOC123528841 [Mercenaria mercenaria]|uniref:uncharacterized protein LOC123528841 n=1 Tax=Mercenaria mercenaria TaxID=6596 RepID=UPI00234F7744|nr:uncharacterized protein LOC123528841 [Mercenaria mercenaria]
MSVKQERKTKKEFIKGHSFPKKKGKKSLNLAKKEKADIDVQNQNIGKKWEVKNPVLTNVKSSSISKSKDTNELENDKHKKLKDRKKFKRMKALKNRQKKLEKPDSQTANSIVVDNVKKTGSTHKDKLKWKNKKLKEKTVKQKDGSKNKGEGLSRLSSPSIASDKVPKTVGKKKLKRLKWKQKQMAKKLARKGLVNTQEHKQVNTDSTEKVELPKTAEGATANWKKLQETMSTQRGEKRKRKIPDHRLRNPKYMKKEDLQGESQTHEKDDSDAEPEIWFDDVDEMLLDKTPVSLKQTVATEGDNGEMKEENPLVKPGAFKGVTKVVCMDCEMVGVGDGSENMLARVSIVNQYGEPVYDKFVKPKEEVVDYRTFVSGVRPQDLVNAEDFEQVQKDVADILNGKILVGHAIKNDLKVLYLSHPRKRIRDTSQYKPFRQLSGGRTPSLKKLSEKVLAVKVQEGEHNSIQDAQATMRLYTMYRKQWENDITNKKKEKKMKKGKT